MGRKKKRGAGMEQRVRVKGGKGGERSSQSVMVICSGSDGRFNV